MNSRLSVLLGRTLTKSQGKIYAKRKVDLTNIRPELNINKICSFSVSQMQTGETYALNIPL